MITYYLIFKNHTCLIHCRVSHPGGSTPPLGGAQQVRLPLPPALSSPLRPVCPDPNGTEMFVYI